MAGDEGPCHSAEARKAGSTTSASFEMTVTDVRPGSANVRMTVRDDMVNEWGGAHAAVVVAVADTALTAACNSYVDVTVAAGFEMSFIAPARLGDRLTAAAEHRCVEGRSGVYDVTVHSRRANEERVVVAKFRGRSRSLESPVELNERVSPRT